jgi:hypothetical protein
MNIESIVRNLGLPLGIVALIIAVLGLLGLSAEQVAGVAGTLVGAQLCIALLINIGKWSGVVSAGTSGKWSALFNLTLFVLIVVQMKFYPAFNVAGLDAQLYEFAKVAGVIFLYATQIIGTKSLHTFMVQGLGIKTFTFKAGNA